GVVGLKPTFGRVSLAGIHPLCQSLDHCGPMARSVRDCALSLEVLAGVSPRDPRTVPVPVERYRDAVRRGVVGMTVGVAERFFFEHTAPDIAARARTAVDALREAGARVVEIDLGWPDRAVDRAELFVPEEAAAVAELWPQRRGELGPDVVEDLQRADGLRALDWALVERARLEYQARCRRLVDDAGVDLIATPAQAFTPPPVGTLRVPFGGRPDVDVTTAMCGLTQVFNVLGWPAVSVPCGRDDAGLPAGLQLAARPWREADCLAGAAVVESAVA
ncbi:MAG: amidase, partial [Gaiellales bacterium]